MARLSLCFCLLSILLNYHGSAKAAPAETPKTASNFTNSGTGKGASLVSTRIVGGQNALPGQFPWQAAVIKNTNAFCGGSIIHTTWILTAGHCVYQGYVFDVTVGTLFTNTPLLLEPDRQTVRSIIGIPHPLYTPNPNQDDNDIGLIQLPVNLLYTLNVKAVPLATLDPEYLLLDLQNVTISGWGKTSDGGSVSSILKYAGMRVLPGSVCAIEYGDLRMDQKICCGSLTGKSTCNGDSGGPLVYRGLDGLDHEVGVVSYGADSCIDGIPVVFSRVTSFLDFIIAFTGLQPSMVGSGSAGAGSAGAGSAGAGSAGAGSAGAGSTGSGSAGAGSAGAGSAGAGSAGTGSAGAGSGGAGSGGAGSADTGSSDLNNTAPILFPTS